MNQLYRWLKSKNTSASVLLRFLLYYPFIHLVTSHRNNIFSWRESLCCGEMTPVSICQIQVCVSFLRTLLKATLVHMTNQICVFIPSSLYSHDSHCTVRNVTNSALCSVYWADIVLNLFWGLCFFLLFHKSACLYFFLRSLGALDSCHTHHVPAGLLAYLAQRPEVLHRCGAGLLSSGCGFFHLLSNASHHTEAM